MLFAFTTAHFEATDCHGLTTPSQVKRTEVSEAIDSHILQSKTERSIPRINALDAYRDRSTTNTAMSYIADSAKDVYDLMHLDRMSTVTAESASLLEAVIVFRNELLERGGSGNACLAGSITYAVHARLYYESVFSKNVNLPLIKDLAAKNRVAVKDVLNAMAQDERWRDEIQSLDLERDDASIPKQFLVKRSQNPERDGFMAWYKCLEAEKSQMHPMFDRHLLGVEALGPHLLLWAILIDDQEGLRLVIDYRNQPSPQLQDLFRDLKDRGTASFSEASRLAYERKDEAVREFDAYIAKNGSVQSPRTFQPLRGDAMWRSLELRIVNFSHERTNLDFLLTANLKMYQDF